MKRVLWLWLIAVPVLAAPKPKATPVEQAAALMAEGELQKALKTLDAALPKTTATKALVALQLLRGQCLAGLQQTDKALAAFTAALERDVGAELDASSANPEAIELLERARSKFPGELSVSLAGGAKGEVRLDGKVLGPAPLRTKVLPGPHTLQAESDDGRSANRTVELKAGRLLEVSLELGEAKPKATPTRAEAPRPEPSAAVAPVAATQEVSAAPSSGRSKLGWLPIGVGAAAAGVGTAFLVSASGAHAALTGTGAPLSGAEADAAVARGKLGQPLGIALVAVGGAAIVGGVVMLLVSSSGEPGNAELGVAPVAGGGVVSVSGRW